MIIDLKNGKNGTAPVVRLNSGHMLPVVGLGTYALHGEDVYKRQGYGRRCLCKGTGL